MTLKAGMAPIVPSGEIAPVDEPWWLGETDPLPRDWASSVPQVAPNREHWFTKACRETDARRAGR